MIITVMMMTTVMMIVMMPIMIIIVALVAAMFLGFDSIIVLNQYFLMNKCAFSLVLFSYSTSTKWGLVNVCNSCVFIALYVKIISSLCRYYKMGDLGNHFVKQEKRGDAIHSCHIPMVLSI